MSSAIDDDFARIQSWKRQHDRFEEHAKAFMKHITYLGSEQVLGSIVTVKRNGAGASISCLGRDYYLEFITGYRGDKLQGIIRISRVLRNDALAELSEVTLSADSRIEGGPPPGGGMDPVDAEVGCRKYCMGVVADWIVRDVKQHDGGRGASVDRLIERDQQGGHAPR